MPRLRPERPLHIIGVIANKQFNWNIGKSGVKHNYIEKQKNILFVGQFQNSIGK
jgi:hypothetical protein